MVTQKDVIDKLAAVGLGLTPRGLTDWTRKGLLPPLQRHSRGTGHGRGAQYAWTDPDVPLHAYTLNEAMRIRGRTDTAKLLTWFAGFNYPTGVMRSLWSDMEQRQRLRALRGAVGGADFHEEDLPDVIQAVEQEVRAFRAGRKLPDGYLHVALGVMLDPNYEPSDITADQVRDVVGYLMSTSRAIDNEFLVKLLGPDVVKGGATFLHEYFSPAKLPRLIRGMSDQELQATHADLRFLAGPYRWWLRSVIEGRILSGVDKDDWRIRLAVSNIFRAGRTFLLTDLALRRTGHGERLERTMEMLQKFVAREDVRRSAGWLHEDYRATTLLHGPLSAERNDDEQRLFLEELRHRVTQNDEIKQVGNDSKDFFELLWELWRPALQPIGKAISERVQSL